MNAHPFFMHHMHAAPAMSAEAAASSCAYIILDSALRAESVFVVLITILALVIVRILGLSTVF